jgi:hypothetical protein
MREGLANLPNQVLDLREPCLLIAVEYAIGLENLAVLPVLVFVGP